MVRLFSIKILVWSGRPTLEHGSQMAHTLLDLMQMMCSDTYLQNIEKEVIEGKDNLY